ESARPQGPSRQAPSKKAADRSPGRAAAERRTPRIPGRPSGWRGIFAAFKLEMEGFRDSRGPAPWKNGARVLPGLHKRRQYLVPGGRMEGSALRIFLG